MSGFLDVPVKPGQVAGKVDKGSVVLNVRDYGAKGDGTTDDTLAIRAAVSAASAGSTIFFPPTGSGAWYRITDTITVTTTNLRFLGNPRDAYAVSIRCAVASKVMLSIKAPGFVLQHVGLIGDGTGTNGVGATVTGVEVFGDTDGNADCTFWNATLQYCAIGVRTHGRNTTMSSDTLFSNCLKGVQIDGKDPVYHTGPGADQNRGNTIRQCRFHNIGLAQTDAAIEITPAAQVLHMLIDGNYFDSNGLGIHIKATGTSANPHKGVSMRSNKHTECQAEAYALTYVNNSTISDADIQGYTVIISDANAITLNNCDTLVIRDILGIQIGGSGVYARNNTSLILEGVKWRVLGLGSGPAAHGFDIDSTNTGCSFDGLRVEVTDGYGFSGSPALSRMGSYEFLTCTLGQITSTTIQPASVFLPASEMTTITGTPNLSGLVGIGYPGAWHMDPAAVEQVVGVAPTLPGTWTTYDVYVVWAPTTATTGNVIWDVNTSIMSDGSSPASGLVSTPGTPSAASGTLGAVTRYKAGTSQTRPGSPIVVRVARNGSSANDTYASDAGLLGVQLVKAS